MFKEVELTFEQEEKWDATMSMMLWTCPGYRHLFLKLLSEKCNAGLTKHAAIFTNDIPNACTDGRNICIKPDWFFKLTVPERVFVIYHEVQHCVYKDPQFLGHTGRTGKVPTDAGKTLPFDAPTMQKSMDFRINALGIEAKIGRPPAQGNFDGATQGTDGLLEVYERTYKKKKKEDKDGGDELGQGNPGGFDTVEKPGTTGDNDNQPPQPINEQEWQIEIAAAQQLESQRRQGKMPAGLSRMFKDILEPEIPWTDHIAAEIARRVGSGSKTWKRPDRRFIGRDIYLPSNTGLGAGWIVIGGDTSGSMSISDLESYIGEIAGIIEDCRPERVSVLWCDAKVSHIDELESADDLNGIRRRGVGGGGGTSFLPVFEWIAQQDEQPEALVYFTDGYGCFPAREPKYEVIWGAITDYAFPWGTTVRIKK